MPRCGASRLACGACVADLLDPVRLGSGVLAGGVTSTQIDLDQAAAGDCLVVIPAVLLIVFVMLSILLRALLAPLILVALVVVSFLASLGVAILA